MDDHALAAEIARLDERLSAFEGRTDEKLETLIEQGKVRDERLTGIEKRLTLMDIADASRAGMARGAWKVAGLGYGALLAIASIIVYIGHTALKIFEKLASP
jgi:hypothetical protein